MTFAFSFFIKYFIKIPKGQRKEIVKKIYICTHVCVLICFTEIQANLKKVMDLFYRTITRIMTHFVQRLLTIMIIVHLILMKL